MSVGGSIALDGYETFAAEERWPQAIFLKADPRAVPTAYHHRSNRIVPRRLKGATLPREPAGALFEGSPLARYMVLRAELSGIRPHFVNF